MKPMLSPLLFGIVRARYSSDFLVFHIMPVLKNATALAEKLNVSEEDKEVIKAAALLHDIACFKVSKKFGLDEDHHLVGVEIAKNILRYLKRSGSFTEQVASCIRTHRGSVNLKPETLPAKIIACADAMAHFDSFFYVLKLFLDSCPTLGVAIDGVAEKMQRDWTKLVLPEAQELAKEKYQAVLKTLNAFWGLGGSQVRGIGVLINGMLDCANAFDELPISLITEETLCCNECKTPLKAGNYCPKCDFAPSLQDVFLLVQCPICGLEAKKHGLGFLCPDCGVRLRLDIAP